MFVDFNILNQLGSPSINSNTFANRPAAGQTGRLFVSTDTYEIYRDNGTTWDLIGGPGSSTVTGTGAATQVAYWTAAQAIGGSNNLWWDNTNGFLGVGTAAPTTRIEAVKTDGIGIYANFTTNAGSGSGTTGIYSINNTASSGYAAVIEERTPNTTGGQYPLLVKHSLSAGTAAVGMGTGLQFQLPDDAGTFKTTQLTIETIDAAAATYKTRYRFNVQNNGSSTPVAYINSTGVGVFTATPSSALDIHSTGIMVQLNSTSATANSLLAFQRSGSGLWRIGDAYNGGNNFFELHNTVLTNNAIQVLASSNEATFLSSKTYSTGNAIGVAVQHNLTIPNAVNVGLAAIGGVNSNLNLTLGGSTTVANTGRQGLEGSTTINFTGAGTLTMTQGTTVRAFSALSSVYAFNGSAVGTITHLAGLRICFPDNVGSAVNITNNYALLINDQTTGTGTVTYTNRWGIYQEGTSDLNYFAANTLIGTTVNNGYKLEVNGSIKTTSLYSNQEYILGNSTNTTFTSAGQIALKNSLNDPYISWHADNGSRIGYLQMQSSGNTDFYVAANQPISFYTNTLERLRITAGGNINILSNSVNTAFTASGQLGVKSATSDPYISWHADNGTRLGYLQMQNGGVAGLSVDVNQPLAIYTNSAERMRIGNDGTTYLGVYNTSRFQFGNTSETFYQYTNTYYIWGLWNDTNSLSIESAFAGNIIFRAQNQSTGSVPQTATERMRINSAGLVGIGTSTPGDLLTVYGTGGANPNALIRVEGTSNYAAFFANNSSGSAYFGIDNSTGTGFGNGNYSRVIYCSSAYPLDFYTNSVIRTRLTSGGNFLIGTTTDAGYKLDVNGTGRFSGMLTMENSGNVVTNKEIIWGTISSGNYIGQYYDGTSLIFYNGTGGANRFEINRSTGEATFATSIKTGAPSGGTAANWKLGSRVAATVVVNTTEYIEIDIGGTLYKLATVT